MCIRDSYYMVDHAEYLIGVFDNQKKLRSGTAQTVNYALHQGCLLYTSFLVGYQVRGQFPKRHLPQGETSDLRDLEN